MCHMQKINKAYIKRKVEVKVTKIRKKEKTHGFLFSCSYMTQVILTIIEFCELPF